MRNLVHCVVVALSFFAAGWVPPAIAATQATFFGSANGSRSLSGPLGAGDTLFVDTTASASGPLSQSVTFTLDRTVTDVSGQAGWLVTTASGSGPRLVGLNIDIVDVATNQVVLSDSFAGVLAGVAHSTFIGSLGPGTYRLEASGNGVRQSLYDLALSFGGTPSGAPGTPLNELPAQGTTTTGAIAFLDALTASRTMSTPFAAGQSLLVDTLVTGATGALLQTVDFVLADGVDGLEGVATWMTSAAVGSGPRLVGVNIDLFDGLGQLVASDLFAGVLGGFAHSTFDLSLGPGAYRLVATGTGVRDASLDIALAFRGTAPTAIPEPAMALLLAIGLTVALAARRRTLRTSS